METAAKNEEVSQLSASTTPPNDSATGCTNMACKVESGDTQDENKSDMPPPDDELSSCHEGSGYCKIAPGGTTSYDSGAPCTKLASKMDTEDKQGDTSSEVIAPDVPSSIHEGNGNSKMALGGTTSESCTVNSATYPELQHASLVKVSLEKNKPPTCSRLPHRVPDYMPFAILIMFAVPMLGLPAIYLTLKSRRLIKDGNTDKAWWYSKWALQLCLCGLIITGLLVCVLYTLFALSHLHLLHGNKDQHISNQTIDYRRMPAIPPQEIVDFLASNVEESLPQQDGVDPLESIEDFPYYPRSRN